MLVIMYPLVILHGRLSIVVVFLLRDAKVGSLYPLFVSGPVNYVLVVTNFSHVSLWHRRLGHMSLKGMKMLSRLQYLLPLDYGHFDSCDHCLYGRQM